MTVTLLVAFGVASVFGGCGILVDFRGMRSWLRDADQRRYEFYGKGTALFSPSDRSARLVGWILLGLGVIALLAACATP